MSRPQSPQYGRSASEGNLADVEDEEPFDETLTVYSDKLPSELKVINTFSTLPRRLGSKKKIKRKQLIDEPKRDKSLKSNFKYTEMRVKKPGGGGFFNKLFRQFGLFPNQYPGDTVYHHVRHLPPELNNRVGRPGYRSDVGKPRLISASNSDIRTQLASGLAETTDHHDNFKDKPPALCGIRNHGNTCFMNAVIQCLSNTDPFAEYFVLDQYKIDLSRHNKIHAKKFGTRGELTEQLAILLKSLWSYQYTPQISNKFKALVAKYGNQYEGSQQHDAQEFLLWLLDKVHEDLNIATKKKYKKSKSSNGRSDSEVAAEVLSNYRRCNISFVQELFQAQFRSSLSCPGCGKCSNTFDPYLCISLPIPHSLTRTLQVHPILQGSNSKEQSKVTMQVDAHSTIKELRDTLSAKLKIPENKLLLTEVSREGVHQSFHLSDPITVIEDTQSDLYALEAPTLKPTSEDEGEHLLIVWINILLREGRKEMFGPVFTTDIAREAKHEEIQKKMLQQMSCILRNNIPKEDLGVLFKLHVNSHLSECSYLPYDVDHPLYMPSVDQALSTCCQSGTGESQTVSGGPPHVKLIAVWDADTKQTLIKCDENKKENNQDPNKQQQKKILKATLQECLELYFIKEKLGADDAWMCPFCKRRQQGIKKLSLWTVPDIFIIHLKRFRQSSSSQRTKLTTNVVFPMNNLDMSAYVTQPPSQQQQQQQAPQQRPPSSNSCSEPSGSVSQLAASATGLATLSNWSPWRRHRSHPYERTDDLYDLYAVCNHHGSMQGGHYTACCKNPVDGRWYLYDDLKVTCVQESEVVTADAYILFYSRSGLSSVSCASSSTSGYSSTGSAVSLMNCEHWAYRMPPFHQLPSKGSQSQDNLCEYEVPALKPVKVESRPFERNQRVYSSLAPKASKKLSSAELDRHSDQDEGTPATETSLPTASTPKGNSAPPVHSAKPNCTPPPPPPSPATSLTPPPQTSSNSSKCSTQDSDLGNNSAASQRIWTVTSV